MKRQEAVEQYAKIQLNELSAEERAEQLEIMSLEDWSDAEGWNALPLVLQKAFENREEIEHPESRIYDPVLMIWLRHRLHPISNSYICQKLGIESIEGEAVKMEACPCCGYRTIGERGEYEICKICWWEDDGQDNQHANQARGGPNYGISLAMGRYNYLVYGLYDPKRKDLMEEKAEEAAYEKGRIFEIVEQEYLREKGSDWKWKIELPDNG